MLAALIDARTAAGREEIAAADARVLYLPPHSPHLNPIEQAFAELKASLRTAAGLRSGAGLRKTGAVAGIDLKQTSSRHSVEKSTVRKERF